MSRSEPSPSAPTQPGNSLYDRVGGANAVATLVGALYFNLLNDPNLAVFFREVSLNRLLKHQQEFFAVAFGAPRDYAGRSLFEIHRELIEQKGLNESHFDALVQALRTTLTDLQVPVDVSVEIVTLIDAQRGVFFSPPSTDQT